MSRSEPNTLVHSSNGRFEVTTVEPRSYRWLNTSRNSSAPVCESGTYPSSSIIRSLCPASCRCRRSNRFSIARLQQFMDESRGGGEANRQPLVAGRETEPETDVCLAGAGALYNDRRRSSRSARRIHAAPPPKASWNDARSDSSRSSPI